MKETIAPEGKLIVFGVYPRDNFVLWEFTGWNYRVTYNAGMKSCSLLCRKTKTVGVYGDSGKERG